LQPSSLLGHISNSVAESANAHYCNTMHLIVSCYSLDVLLMLGQQLA
jgi:hypothetical protein